ncbi:MAG: hypothetical protein ACRYFU_17020 [Janthinobacterium lividum]
MTSEFGLSFTEQSFVDEGIRFRPLKLTLGNFVEGELADLTSWSETDYEEQWMNELRAIVNSRDRGALIVSVHDPAHAFHIRSWPMWRIGTLVYFQSRILFMLDGDGHFDPKRVHELVGSHMVQDEDGQQLSEWSVSALAIWRFLDQHSSGMEN